MTTELCVAKVVGACHAIITVHVRSSKLAAASPGRRVARITLVDCTSHPIIAFIVVDVVLAALAREAEVLRAVYAVVAVVVLGSIGTACHRVTEVACTCHAIVTLRIRSGV